MTLLIENSQEKINWSRETSEKKKTKILSYSLRAADE
ncbi:hypothetical protein CAEBREN_15602 [Caenorhabditis brenneri]|uniref:Uncharacterized protein n=1 Tax=Caenorhabditis brenneri TaxID=135651 RepID=G0PN24_CAEBE|nr:hypothetical protein CAEBREN_15602 [Caenorhabditis brenneri]